MRASEPSDPDQVRCACPVGRPDASAIARYFDATTEGSAPISPGASALLLQWLVDAGLPGHDLLDLGCGSGRLIAQALQTGATTATGIDLSPASIALAAHRLRASRLGDRATVVVGDAALLPLPTHHTVCLDKVICCYPNPTRLIERSMAAATVLYAISIPESRGAWGVLVRARRAWKLGVDRLRGQCIPRFIPDVDAVEEQIRSAGFSPVRTGRRFIWYVGVYRRSGDIS